MRHALLVVLVLTVSPIASGCLGSSSPRAPAAPPSVTTVFPAASALLDSATRGRLLAEYRASRIPLTCPPGVFCSEVRRGTFWTGRGLLRVLHRAHPSIAATDDMNATLSLDIRIVFVLSDSTARRLDLATAAADGRYVHLIAVGSHPPRFRFGALWTPKRAAAGRRPLVAISQRSRGAGKVARLSTRSWGRTNTRAAWWPLGRLKMASRPSRVWPVGRLMCGQLAVCMWPVGRLMWGQLAVVRTRHLAPAVSANCAIPGAAPATWCPS